jgi:hypothetical protein
VTQKAEFPKLFRDTDATSHWKPVHIMVTVSTTSSHSDARSTRMSSGGKNKKGKKTKAKSGQMRKGIHLPQQRDTSLRAPSWLGKY